MPPEFTNGTNRRRAIIVVGFGNTHRGNDAYRYSGSAERQTSRLDGTGERRTVPKVMQLLKKPLTRLVRRRTRFKIATERIRSLQRPFIAAVGCVDPLPNPRPRRMFLAHVFLAPCRESLRDGGSIAHELIAAGLVKSRCPRAR